MSFLEAQAGLAAGVMLAAGEIDHGEYRLPLTISLMTTAGAVQ